jgi:hypothetical protein
VLYGIPSSLAIPWWTNPNRSLFRNRNLHISLNASKWRPTLNCLLLGKTGDDCPGLCKCSAPARTSACLSVPP